MTQRHTALVVASSAVFLGLFTFILVEPSPTRFDYIADDLLRAPDNRDPWGDEPTEVAIDYVLMAIVDTALVVAAWNWGSVRSAMVVLLTIATQEVVIRASKSITARPRPEDAFSATGAYPSGHVANVSIAILLFFLIVLPLLRKKRLAQPFRGESGIAGAAIVTFALYRVFAGEHWITDVIGAVALSLAFAIGAQMVHERMQTEKP